MDNIFNTTIKDSYYTMEMPDGQTVLMEKLSDGSWVPVEKRIEALTKTIEKQKSPTEQFEQNWQGAHTKPHEWKTPTSLNVTRKKKTVKEIEEGSDNTFKHLHAHLIEILGQPTQIIQNKKLFKEIKDPSIRRTTEKIIEALYCYEWDDVLKIMKGETI